jgi:hypothetical protein
MVLKREVLIAYLLTTAALGIASPTAPVEANSINATFLSPRFNQRYDQIRLMTCRTYRDIKPQRYDRLIGYYSHSPGISEKPTQVAYLEKGATPSWENGCDGSSRTHGKSSDGAEWACDIPKYKFDPKQYFKKFMGTMTYGYTGFNCFHDDGHLTHYQPDGFCTTELYCTHERKQSLAIDASKQTVKAEYHANFVEDGKTPNIPTENARALVKSYLQKVKDGIRGQQCSADAVKLTPNCQAVLTCDGTEPKYLTLLADALIAAYDNEKNEKGEAL